MMQSVPQHWPHAACAPVQVVISGKRGAADTEALVDAAFRPFAPGEPWGTRAECSCCRRLFSRDCGCRAVPPCPPLSAEARRNPEPGRAAPQSPPPCSYLLLPLADKLVIQLDPSDSAAMDFWRATNPAAVQVAEGKRQEGAAAFVCQVRRTREGLESCEKAATASILTQSQHYPHPPLPQDFTCKAPTSDPAKVAQLLSEPRRSAA